MADRDAQPTERRKLFLRKLATTLACLAILLAISLLLAQAISAQARMPVSHAPNATETSTPVPTTTPTYSLDCEVVIHDSIPFNAPIQVAQILSSHIPSECQLRSCPGFSDTNPHRYKAYTFQNPSNAQCVTVRLNSTACAGNLFSAAYSVFNPGNPCSGYLADIGDVISTTGSYNVSLEPGQLLTVVVDAAASLSSCSDFTLTFTPQSQCLVTPTPTITPIPTATFIGTPTFPAYCQFSISDFDYAGRSRPGGPLEPDPRSHILPTIQPAMPGPGGYDPSALQILLFCTSIQQFQQPMRQCTSRGHRLFRQPV